MANRLTKFWRHRRPPEAFLEAGAREGLTNGRTLSRLRCMCLSRWEGWKDTRNSAAAFTPIPSSQHHWYLQSGRGEKPRDWGAWEGQWE